MFLVSQLPTLLSMTAGHVSQNRYSLIYIIDGTRSQRMSLGLHEILTPIEHIHNWIISRKLNIIS